MSKAISASKAIGLIEMYNISGLERIAFLQSIKLKHSNKGKGKSKSGKNYRRDTSLHTSLRSYKRECERRVNQMRKANV